MRLIERAELDIQKWNELVENSKDASVYNQSGYIDAFAKNWCALVIGDYEAGLALPYAKNLGVKRLYTPNFIRSFDWLGDIRLYSSKVDELLRNEFSSSALRTNQKLFHSDSKDLKYQIIDFHSDRVLSKQAKRSLSKFAKSNAVIEEIPMSEALPVIVKELKVKVRDIAARDFDHFESFLNAYPVESTYVIGLRNQRRVEAAQIFIEYKNYLLYIKGGAFMDAKKNGAMYGLMESAIQYAKNKNLQFSFEGSIVESVEKFNLGLGGKNLKYWEWKWGNLPLWFKLALKIRN